MPDFTDNHDFLSNSTALRHLGDRRVIFNPENQLHVDSLKVFLRTGNWGDYSFFCEAPFTDVPTTVLMAFAQYELNVKRETPSETQQRLSKMELAKVPAKETPKEKAERLKASSQMALNA